MDHLINTVVLAHRMILHTVELIILLLYIISSRNIFIVAKHFSFQMYNLFSGSCTLK